MFFKAYLKDATTGEILKEGNQRIEIPLGAIPEAQRYLDNGYIFKDDAFNEQSLNLSGIAKFGFLPTDGPNGDAFRDSTLQVDTSTFYIHLETLSEEAYNFYSSHAMALGTEVDFFSEPSAVFGNVEKGLGIFAGVYVSEKAIEVEY